ncbi:MAG: hypothetical protein AAGG48_14325 [Planctomycetota bacterium]
MFARALIPLLGLLYVVASATAEDTLLRLETPSDSAPLKPDWLQWSIDLETEVSREVDTDRNNEPKTDDAPPLPEPSGVQRALATGEDTERFSVRPIRAYVHEQNHPSRMVRYDVPLDDHTTHQAFQSHGVPGTLLEVPVKSNLDKRSTLEKARANVFSLVGFAREKDFPDTVKVVRYEVPADELVLHQSLSNLESEIYEPSLMRLPEVRFFQPKARVFMDLKRSNDGEFDLFSNGAVLASLDVVELYMPMPLISDRFARVMGKPTRLSQIGWRVGATVGVGITTALTNTDGTAGSAPISTMSAGLRYDFPLGRPSTDVIETGDLRLDQRTRVGIETGIQGGITSNEAIGDSTDLGWYFGILVNTPWTHY